VLHRHDAYCRERFLVPKPVTRPTVSLGLLEPFGQLETAADVDSRYRPLEQYVTAVIYREHCRSCHGDKFFKISLPRVPFPTGDQLAASQGRGERAPRRFSVGRGCRTYSEVWTLLLSLRWACSLTARTVSDPEVRSNVFKSLLLNAVSLTSIYFFDLLLSPLTHEHSHWLRRNLGTFYQVLWLFPVMGASLYLNVRAPSVCLPKWLIVFV
jgi:hypothetical protein